MPFDPYAKVFRPDFQANQELPQWQPMGEDDQGQQATQATGSIVDLLKSRMAGRTPDAGDPARRMPRMSESQIADRAGTAANIGAGPPPVMPALKGGAAAGGGAGGGMKSL